MRDFVDTLPLRLAAVVATLVGIICLWTGVELWESARRIGIAFVVLLLAGLMVRRLILSLHGEMTDDPGERYPRREEAEGSSRASAAPAAGRNVDVIAPGAAVGDLLRDDDAKDE